jgi:hypothetical protein
VQTSAQRITNVSVDHLEEPDPLDDLLNDTPADAKADGWGFWGSSLKSAKKATPASETKKEIGSAALTNGRSLLTDRPKAPEPTVYNDTLPSKSATTASTKAKTTVKGNSSVQDRIKALQGEKESSATKAAKEPTPPAPPPPELEPVVVEDRKSKKSTATATTKTSSASKRDKKESSSLATDPTLVAPKPSSSPLPGGFPLDDLLDLPPADKMASPAKKSSSKDKEKKPSKPSKKDAMPAIVDPPATGDLDDLLMDDDLKLPTPPPEKSKKDDSRPSKKERPKVVRDQQSSSWGFWGAAPPPKSNSKRSKDGASSPTEEKTEKADRPRLSRSRSARKASDKDPLEKASKSSGSEKDGKSKSRPTTSRGMSFSMFGMGSTPSRSKSTRDRHSSRRHSVAVDDSGMISPPPDDVKPKEMSAKAAKVMGVNRSKSTREKTKARKVPDPYAIDDDDMVMVDNPEDSAKDVPQFEIPSRDKKKSSKSRRQSTMMSGGLGEADDAVMVDAPRASDEPELLERPSPVRRTTSSAKKGGLMGGIFGAFSGNRPTPDRRQSKMYESEDGNSRRKRGSVYEDDSTKRLRRDDRKVGRTRKPSDADGLTDAAPATDAEAAAAADAKEARRAERRAKREREAAEEDAKTSRRRDKDDARRAKEREERDRLAKEDEEREARKQEERRARRETRRAEGERLAREDEARTTERRERRREREREPEERPKAERRRSYMPGSEDDEARRARHEERRMRRSVDVTAGAKDRPRASRRRSDYPAPVDDYFGRNGEPVPANGRSPLADSRPYQKPQTSGKDKTTSWVDSLNEDPPPPPPVEGTIIDAPAHFAEDDEPDDPTTARELKHRRRRDDDDPDSRRKKKSSDGSSRDRDRDWRKSYAGGPVNSLGHNDFNGKTFDGRPAGPLRRESWFKKIAGL